MLVACFAVFLVIANPATCFHLSEDLVETGLPQTGAALLGGNFRTSFYPAGIQKRQSRMRMCGDNLMVMLYLACGTQISQRWAGIIEHLNQFDGIVQKRGRNMNKRSLDDSTWNEARAQLAEYGDKGRMGLAESCCRNSCSIGEIRGFC
ncbi:insulin [Eurytemora carolleeae]|uniref:insulin n=1 Tax=Eurytemora carolleeae TaxID=1294199 RepID=UPI000C7609FC|nr:insulin [Eurytemora carolleeae]|eukprot:XP_023334998.1 insulin-like [Eurytemora affinis]